MNGVAGHPKELAGCSLSVGQRLHGSSLVRTPLEYRAPPQRLARMPQEPLISIVDDDRPVREALRRMLGIYGFDAVIFKSAEEFLASDFPTRTACLVADMRMPGMSGLALHRHLLAEGCRIPTILITARPTSGERDEAVASGVLSYLAKPVSDNILVETVQAALERSKTASS